MFFDYSTLKFNRFCGPQSMTIIILKLGSLWPHLQIGLVPIHRCIQTPTTDPVATFRSVPHLLRRVERDEASAANRTTDEEQASDDNLHSQTTPDFRAALKRNGVKGYSHALLAGNTDGLQPVDGGVGALLKAEQEEVFDEWLENDNNWKEWTGTRMKASRKRAVLTQLYGVAWERVCRAFPFPKVTAC